MVTLHPEVSLIELIKLARIVHNDLSLVDAKGLVEMFVPIFEAHASSDMTALRGFVRLVAKINAGEIAIDRNRLGEVIIVPARPAALTDDQIWELTK